MDNLPMIRVDEMLSQITGLKTGSEVKSYVINKKIWDYIKAHDLKVKKVWAWSHRRP